MRYYTSKLLKLIILENARFVRSYENPKQNFFIKYICLIFSRGLQYIEALAEQNFTFS
jgi:hypothetical protein